MHAQDPQSRKSQFSELLGVSGGLAGFGDPGDEHVVRMVDEVISREGIDELAIAAVVRGRDRDELAVARARRETLGPDKETVSLWREQCGHNEDPRIVACLRRLDDRRDRRVVARYETSEQLVHACDNRGLR